MIFDLSNYSKNLGLHWDSDSQNGNPFGSVWVHSFTFSHISKSVNVTLSSCVPSLHISMPLFWLWTQGQGRDKIDQQKLKWKNQY
jgi:hypothetical protein